MICNNNAGLGPSNAFGGRRCGEALPEIRGLFTGWSKWIITELLASFAPLISPSERFSFAAVIAELLDNSNICIIKKKSSNS